MLCNPTKRKQLGNYRQSTKDIDAGLKVVRTLTLEGPSSGSPTTARRGDAGHGAGAQATS